MVGRGHRGSRHAQPPLLALPDLHAEAAMITHQAPIARSWRQTVAAALTEAAGLVRLTILPPECLDQLLDTARDGDPEACRLTTIVAQLSIRLDAHDTPSDDTPACLLCQRAFWCDRYPRVLAVLNADIPAPDACLVTGICCGCAAVHGSTEALHTAILAALRDRFGLALRTLPPFAITMGHA
jgi:hypothetical protein